MSFFKPGKVFELQKWTEDETLNGKILGIIDKKSGKGKYPCYIFESQQIINATAAQLTYPELDANNKKQLMELLETVIRQKKTYQINLAEKAEENEKRKLLEQRQREEQNKIQASIPSVVFDISDTNTENVNNVSEGTNQNTKIVIQQPAKDLYKTDDSANSNLSIQKRESNIVPKGYALVPVSTLNEVIEIKNEKGALQQKEIELITKENELNLAKKKNEMELKTQKKEIEMTQKHLGGIEKGIQRREENNRKYEEEIMRKQRESQRGGDYKRKKKRGDRENGYDEDRDREDRKRKKKRKKKKKKDGSTTTKCLKCLCRLSSICFIIAVCGGLAGCYFYFLQSEDDRVYAFIAWAGAILAFVFGVLFYCKG